VAIAIGGPAEGAPVPHETVERRLTAMGTELLVTIEAPARAEALAASEACLRAIEETEARLSTWRPGSELSLLNRTPPGTPFVPSAALAADLGRALHWRRETRGAFDPSAGSLVEAWGLRAGGRRPGKAELDRAIEGCGEGAFHLDLPHQLVRRNEWALIEEGAFGKGIALDAALEAALEAGATHTVVDLGGQVAASSTPQPLRFAVADPLDREHCLLTLDLERGSIATSGNGERGLEIDGERYGHLLDPRSGHPAPDFGSLTVWASNATDADCLSTALYVLGPDEALAFAGKRDGIEVIVIEKRDNERSVRATSGLRGRLKSLEPDLEVKWSSPHHHREEKETKRR